MNFATFTFPVHDEPLPLRRRLELCFEAQGLSVPMRDRVLAFEMPIRRTLIIGGRRVGRATAMAAYAHCVDAQTIRHEDLRRRLQDA